jgi:hypothetical protein
MVLKKPPSSSAREYPFCQLSHQLNHLACLFAAGITVAK